MSDTDQDSRNLDPAGDSASPTPSPGTPQGEEEDLPATSVTELARLARRAFEDRRWRECLALTRAIREIDTNHKGAREIESWIRSDLEADLSNARSLLEHANPRVQEERAHFLLSRILSVDFEHPEANELLLEVASRISASDAGFQASPGTDTEPAGQPERAGRDSDRRPAPSPPFVDRSPQRRRGAPPSPRSRPGSMFGAALRDGGPYAGPGVGRPKTSKKTLATGIVSVAVAIAVVAGGIRYQDQLVEIVTALTTGAPTGTAGGPSPDDAVPSGALPVATEIAAAAEPPEGPARLDLVLIPGTGVDVSVDGGPFQPVPPFLDLEPGSHTLEFEAEGFEPHATSAEVSAGERRVAAIVLNPSAPGANSPEFARGGPDPGTAPTPPPPAAPDPPAAPPPPPEVTLQINARPWAQVYLDGPEMEPLGQTPLGNVRVPAGSVLVFRNPGFPEKRHEVAASDETIQMAFP